MGVEERLLFDRVALGSGGVSPGDVEYAAAVIANFADSRLAFRDGAAVSAGEAADAVVLESFVESGVGFADSLVENGTEGGQREPLSYFNAGEIRVEFTGPDKLHATKDTNLEMPC
jgi:hypothetical protein